MKHLTLVICCIVAIALTALPAIAQPPVLWMQTFGETTEEYGECVQQTDDGGFIVAGFTNSFGAGSLDAILIKTDQDGNETWSQTFGGVDGDAVFSVQQTSDGGYIMVGNTWSFGMGYGDVWLIKTDQDGNELWSQTFGGSLNEDGTYVQQTSDGGYIITGFTVSFGAGSSDLWLIKTDASGNELWSQTFGGEESDRGDCVQQTADGGYIITGQTTASAPAGQEMWLIKTDASGNAVWSRTFGGNDWDHGHSVKQTQDGGYILVGSTASFGAGLADVILIRTDADGNQLWARVFGDENHNRGLCVQITPDNGYIIAGNTDPAGPNIGDAWLIRTDSDGEELWSQTLGGASSEDGRHVQLTEEGGFIVTGFTGTFGAGSHDVLLVRLGSEEPTPLVTITLTPHDQPIQIPAGGDPFFWDVEISNTLEDEITGQFWTEVILPNGSTYSGPPLLMVDFLTLWPGNTIAVTGLVQYVPNFAPPGNYTYIAKFGFFPETVYGEDSFEFEKLGVAAATIHDDYGWTTSGWHVEEDQATIETHPSEHSIESIYPNPFNPTTSISVNLSDFAELSVAVYNVTGQQVAELAGGSFGAGTHQFIFDATDMSSGIYFVRATVKDRMNEMRKVIFMK
jgi:Secretion system C-terminal sorting domain